MGGDTRRSSSLMLFTLVLGVYSYFYQAGGWNQNARFDLTRAVVEHGSLRIDNYHVNTGDKALRNGHYYSDKAPGVSLMAVPVYAVVHAIDGRHKRSDRYQATASYLCTLWSVGVPSALAAMALYHLAAEWMLPVGVLIAFPLAYAFATQAFPYSTLFYGHQAAAAWLVMSFVALATVRATSHIRSRRLIAVGFFWGLAIAIEYPSMLAVAVLLVYSAVIVRPRRRLLWLAAGAAAPLALLAVYHTVAFGGPTTLPYEFSTQQHRHGGFFMGLGLPQATVLREILVGEYRGLLPLTPWLALSIPGALALLRKHRAEALTGVALALGYLWMNASLNDWHGGWGIGPRHLIPVIPFLAVLSLGVFAVPLSRPLRRVLAGFGIAGVVLSMFLMTVATAVKPEVPVRCRRPVQGYLLPAFFEGNLAMNVQSFKMAKWRGFTERRAWNLGEKIGLSGLATLIPLGVFFAFGAGAWGLLVRRDRDHGPLMSSLE